MVFTNSTPGNTMNIGNVKMANDAQATQAVQVQSYCYSVLEQPDIDFGDVDSDNLKQTQVEANALLKKARGHANNFNDNIVKEIIVNITNIENQMELHKAVATALPAGSSKEEWISTLKALEDQSRKYGDLSAKTARTLTKLSSNLTDDAREFDSIVVKANEKEGGAKAILENDKKQVKTIQKKQDGLIAAMTISGLTTVAGGFLVAIGSIAEFVTDGASTPVVVGGVALIAVGAAGEAASIIAYEKLGKQLKHLFDEESTLKTEIKLLTSINGAFDILKDKANVAAQAADQMSSAWKFLAGDLNTLSEDLKKGETSVGAIQTLFLTAANNLIPSVLDDVSTIKKQMTGVVVDPGKPGESLIDVLDAKFGPQTNVPVVTAFVVDPTPGGIRRIVGKPPRFEIETLTDNVTTANKNNASAVLVAKAYIQSTLVQPECTTGYSFCS